MLSPIILLSKGCSLAIPLTDHTVSQLNKYPECRSEISPGMLGVSLLLDDRNNMVKSCFKKQEKKAKLKEYVRICLIELPACKKTQTVDNKDSIDYYSTANCIKEIRIKVAREEERRAEQKRRSENYNQSLPTC
ncbi:hypothetical protein [Oceanisphaera pacifica]|uniref:Uncharacterized protein n=1 Tax=Oceanisphaera pacifica TaxID=2818389 RepID=A0ABS3NG66_9GAMM|nr:hypothetical protein [Oceanisphaera pacifica]MBO1519581.1 hypothetical protein [Oceanisphaera pacifica]